MIRGVLRRTRARASRRPPVPFVVGVTRSGTTLLRLMLDSHPELAIPPETHFVPELIKAAKAPEATPESIADVVTGHRQWGDFNLDAEALRERYRRLERVEPGAAIRAFFELYAERAGKPRWGDKTPNYIKRMRQIQRFVPEARFVHMIRDGRDAALSRASRRLREAPPMETVAARWRRKIRKARADSEELAHYREVRYEDLVADPEPVLRSVCELLELPWDERLLSYHERAGDRLAEMDRDLPAEPGRPTRPADHRLEAHRLATKPPDPGRIARWRTEMDAADVAAFERAAGDLLAELGYEVSTEVTA